MAVTDIRENFEKNCKRILQLKERRRKPIKSGVFLVLAVLGLHCRMWALSGCSEWGPHSVARRGLIVVASLIAEHRLEGTWSQ